MTDKKEQTYKPRPWSEEHWYVDCPFCEAAVDLGVDVIVNVDTEITCDDCGETFETGPQHGRNT